MAEEAQILGTGNFRYEAKKKEEQEELSTAKGAKLAKAATFVEEKKAYE